ncbi:hypothetical protein ACFY36_42110 [Actinoplanes sp. NPDC000266]
MTEQRVAVVTGASRGVGKGIAVALGAAGFVVHVTGRSTGGRVTFPAVGGTVGETARAVTAAQLTARDVTAACRALSGRDRAGRGIRVHDVDGSRPSSIRAGFAGRGRAGS